MKILYRAHNFYTFVHVFQWTSEFFFNFRFFSRKSQSQQKLSKKVTYFTIQFHSKNLIRFTNLNSLDIENNMLSQHRQKPFWHCLVLEKTFALHHFWTPKNCILEALWKQISLYFCLSLSESFCPRDVARFYLMESGLMGRGGESLNNFFKAARCMGLIKCFTIFHFNWSFWKFNFFQHFDNFLL